MSSSVSVDGNGPSPASDKLDKSVLLVAGVVVLGAIMSILDVTVVSVALSTFSREFEATTAEVAWTMTGYTLALAMVIPVTGWASDRFGTKRLYLLAVTLFTLGSVLCALATDLNQLIAFRVLQGLGGGMLMPLGMTMLTKAAGPERVGRVMAVMGIPMLLGPIAGPILGGVMIDHLSWHWIFLINLPIGIIALVYAWYVLPKDDVHPSETFDFVGMLLLSPGLALFLYGVSSIPGAKEEHGTPWTGEVISTMILGALLIIAFVPWALRKANKHPLMDLRLFKNPTLTVAVIAMSLFAIAFFGASLLFPMFFQGVHGMSPTNSGWMLAPQGLGAMITMPVAGFLVDKIGPGKIVMLGITVVTIGMALFTQIDETTSNLFSCFALFVMGLGMGGTMMPIMTAALATLREHTVARGSTLMNIVQQVAGSIGTAVFSVVLTSRLLAHDEYEASRLMAKGLMDAGIEDPKDPKNAEAVGQVVAQVAQQTGLSPESFTTSLPHIMSPAFQGTFWLAVVLCALVIVPAFFLPRKKVAPVDVTALASH